MTIAIVVSGVLQLAWWTRAHALLRGRLRARIIVGLFVLAQLAWLASVWRWGLPEPDGAVMLAWHTSNLVWHALIVPIALVLMLVVGTVRLGARALPSGAG